MHYAPPAVKDAAWVRNPIDNFVLAKLEKEGLKPSPEADKTTLIRRVYLDLIGLPPTPKQVDAFLADKRPEAYEKVVDELLASPRYGERWARPWLDLARYADTNGYEKDGRRTAWKYRDWVINALNRDESFKQFTIDQIAGDMLPHPTTDQLIATGFNRNTMLNQEGGVDPEEYYWYELVDRVNTTASVWLGSTLGCAQCHNHKFDPFTQKDYYRFLAFYGNGSYKIHGEGSERYAEEPDLEIPTPDQQQKARSAAKTNRPTSGRDGDGYASFASGAGRLGEADEGRRSSMDRPSPFELYVRGWRHAQAASGRINPCGWKESRCGCLPHRSQIRSGRP